jgi:hypothetical protein
MLPTLAFRLRLGRRCVPPSLNESSGTVCESATRLTGFFINTGYNTARNLLGLSTFCKLTFRMMTAQYLQSTRLHSYNSTLCVFINHQENCLLVIMFP